MSFIKKETKSIEANVMPPDSKNAVFILFFLLGLVHILPWTFFTTASEYWMYKFRDVNDEDALAEDRTQLQTMFSPGLLISLSVSNVCCSLLSLFYGYKFSIKLRLIGSLTAIFICFVVSTIFIKVNTDSWQYIFFGITIVTVAAINGFNSILGYATYTILGNFTSDYFGSYIFGQGLGPICSSSLQVLSLAIGLSEQTSALVYFGAGLFVIGVTLLYLMIIQKNEFYMYNMQKGIKIEKEKRLTMTEIKEVIIQIRYVIISCTTFLITLTFVNPNIMTLIVSECEGCGPWNDTYYVPVISFLMAAIADYIGRILGKIIENFVGGKLLAWTCFLRIFIFIPLIMLCNAQPRHHLPVVFGSDYQYILIIFFFSLTNGMLMTLFSLLIPKSVKECEMKRTLQVYSVLMAILLAALSCLGIVSVKLL